MDVMYVYGLSDPRDRRIRYVGVSANPIRRLHRHARAARRRERSPVARWLRSMRRRPVLEILAVTMREQAVHAERGAIATLRALGADLVNRTAGGDGLISTEHVALLAEGMRRLWTKPEYRAARSAQMTALWRQPRTRARWLRARRNSSPTKERSSP